MKLFRIIAITVAVSLAALGAAVVSTPTPALATTLEVEGATPATPNYQQIVNESQEPTANLTMVTHVGVCPEPDLTTEVSCASSGYEYEKGLTAQIWMDPESSPFVILHEDGHVEWWLSSPIGGTLNPVGEEFERIVGKVGWKWEANSNAEPFRFVSPNEEWADTLMTCSWMGKVATGPTVTTASYGFVLSANQYNEVCAFFARVLVGPKFSQPTAAPLPPIPYNYTGSPLCGARPELVQYCGHAAAPQGFGRPQTREAKTINAEVLRASSRPKRPSKPQHKLRRKPKKGKVSKPAPNPAGGTKIVMTNPREQATFQSIVSRSQEPTPNLTITVHHSNCPYASAQARSCVAYPNPAESTATVPQIWISHSDPKYFILGELGYVSWWELDPTTEMPGSIGEAFEAAIGIGSVSTNRSGGLSNRSVNPPTWRVQSESPKHESVAQVWADTLLSCSWMGRTIHGNETVPTLGYGVPLGTLEYNDTCVFFLNTLVGPKFDPPTAPALPVIPRNYTLSTLCSARPELVKYCGKPAKKGKRVKKHKR